jgi:hypothetical protein
VGLLSRLFHEAVKRIEASPGYRAAAERYKRTEPFESAALGLAYSTLSDEEACAMLREWIGAADGVVQEAVESSAQSRRDYAHDRAYRLLSAALSNEPVQPIDPVSSRLFREEENLGRLPLGEAFDLLAAREPKPCPKPRSHRPVREGSTTVTARRTGSSSIIATAGTIRCLAPSWPGASLRGICRPSQKEARLASSLRPSSIVTPTLTSANAHRPPATI